MNDSAPGPNLTTLGFQTMKHGKRAAQLVADDIIIIIGRWAGI